MAKKHDITHVPLEAIRCDGGTQPRAELDLDFIEELKNLVIDGHELPPVDLWYDGTMYWLSDGFHRHEAYLRADKNTIPATIHAGTQADAQWASYAANQTHGLRRTNEDKARAVQAALRHPYCKGLSARAIADHIGVSNDMVSRYKIQVSSDDTSKPKTVTGRDGKTYPASRPAPVAPGPEDDGDLPDLLDEAAEVMGEPPSDQHPAIPDPDHIVAADEMVTPEQRMAAANSALESLARKITACHTDAVDLAGSNPHLTHGSLGDLETKLRAAANGLRAIKGHAVCPRCEGAGCDTCRGSGWVSRTTYDSLC
jgi:hypothetical protein